MEISEVKFRRYTPAEGKALKIQRILYYPDGSNHEYTSYSINSTFVLDCELAAPVEEVDIKEFQEWYEKEKYCFSVGNSTL